MRKTLVTFCATTGGVGLIPGAPGTYGSLLGLATRVLLCHLHITWYADILLIAVLIAVGIWSASAYEKITQKTDPSACVIDEFVGMLLATLFLPCQGVWLIIAFILFRLLDILKPWHINTLQKLPGGWGIMADDCAAGIVTALIVHTARYLQMFL